jgi:hypothetical protein
MTNRWECDAVSALLHAPSASTALRALLRSFCCSAGKVSPQASRHELKVCFTGCDCIRPADEA